MREGEIEVNGLRVEVDVHNCCVGGIVHVATAKMRQYMKCWEIMRKQHKPPVLCWEVWVPGTIGVLSPEERDERLADVLILVDGDDLGIEENIDRVV